MSKALVLGLVFLCSFFASSGMANPKNNTAEAEQILPLVCTGAWANRYAFAGLIANFTSEVQNNITVNVFFAWYNPAGQVVSVSEQFNATFEARQTLSFFSSYTSSGVFDVVALVQDSRGNALSVDCSGQVIIP